MAKGNNYIIIKRDIDEDFEDSFGFFVLMLLTKFLGWLIGVGIGCSAGYGICCILIKLGYL